MSDRHPKRKQTRRRSPSSPSRKPTELPPELPAEVQARCLTLIEERRRVPLPQREDLVCEPSERSQTIIAMNSNLGLDYLPKQAKFQTHTGRTIVVGHRRLPEPTWGYRQFLRGIALDREMRDLGLLGVSGNDSEDTEE